MDAIRERIACELCLAAPWWDAVLNAAPGWNMRATLLKDKLRAQAEAFFAYGNVLREVFVPSDPEIPEASWFYSRATVELSVQLGHEMALFGSVLVSIAFLIARVCELNERAERIAGYAADPWFATVAEKTRELSITAQRECIQVAAIFEARYPQLAAALQSSPI